MPDLLPAPSSDVGALARRLIECADFTAVAPLLDALRERQRGGTATKLMAAVAEWAYQAENLNTYRRRWANRARGLLMLFWHDLFDLTATLAAAEGSTVTEEQAEEQYGDGAEADDGVPTVAGMMPARIRMDQDVAAGQWVELQTRNRTVPGDVVEFYQVAVLATDQTEQS